jgi:S1-C subfamily serine protease
MAMKRAIVGFFAAAVLSLLLLANVSLAGEFEFKIAEKRDAIVAFAPGSGGHERHKGSGFLLDDIGHVVTTCGVLNGDYSKVCVRANGGGSYSIKKLIAKDENLNLVKVLLEVPRDRLLRLGFSEVLSSLDEPLFVLGSDENEQMITRGAVSAMHLMPDGRKMIEITAPPHEACCCGPVVNTRGQVIGVSSPRSVGGRTMHTVIPIRYVKELGKKPAWGWEKMHARDVRSLGNVIPVEWGAR